MVKSDSLTNFDEFTKSLSEGSLNKLNNVALECEELMLKKTEYTLPNLENSNLHKELVEKKW